MLHVLTGASCNNNCLFCMEADRDGRRRHVEAQTRRDVRSMIQDYPDKAEILFTSGEPTLNPDLPEYLGWAAGAGFATIGLITNARRLAYRSYAEQLVARGLNKVTVSIHGHTPKLHEGLTRTRGSFQQTMAGLDRLVRLRQSGAALELCSSTVVVRRNLPFVQQIHAHLGRAGIHRQVYNVLMLKGRGLDKFDLLMPRYTDIAAAFDRLAAGLSPGQARRVSLADIPRCAAGDLPLELIGDQEQFDQFEPCGSTGISGIGSDQLAGDEDGVQDLRRAMGRAAPLAGGAEYYLTSRQLKDRLLRVKRPECGRCRFDGRCPGVWRAYADRHGWSEFEPVLEPKT